MKKLLLLLCIMCTVVSCGDDDLDGQDIPSNQTKRIKSMTISYSIEKVFKEIMFAYDAQDRISEITMEGIGQDVDYWKCILVYEKEQLHLKFVDKQGLKIEDLPDVTFNLNEQGLVYSSANEWWLFEGSDDFELEYEDGKLKQAITYQDDNLSKEVCYWEKGNLYSIRDNNDIYNFHYTDYENKAKIMPSMLTQYCRSLPDNICTYDPDIALDFLFCHIGIYGKSSAKLVDQAKQDDRTCLFTYEFDEEGYPINITCSDGNNKRWENFDVHIQYLDL